MPDLLTHALIAYVLWALLSWPGGPSDATVTAALGVPFDWLAIHTLGGSAVCVAIGTVVVDAAERRRTLGLLSLGAGSHLLADAFLLKASGRSYDVLWPLTRYHPPTPGIYHSTDVWPSLLAMLVAGTVWLVRRRATHTAERE